MSHHNALHQVSLKAGHLTVQGFSISGLATYVQIPELDVCFDMGECPLSSLSLNHVFLTHAHGDHARCLPRHWQLRRMLGNERPAAYFLPDAIADGCIGWIRAEARFEGVPEADIITPQFVRLSGNGAVVPLPHRKDLRVRAFDVRHTVPSLGYTVLAHKTKLKPEFVGLPGPELARLRKEGTPIQAEVQEPLVTFIGDCEGRTLLERDELWRSPVLILEATFLDPGEESFAQARGHTHLSDIVQALEEWGASMQCQHIVLKHFSMRYEPEVVHERVRAAVPARFADVVKVFL